jgi:tetratricopeptide (TPR) repeat protein
MKKTNHVSQFMLEMYHLGVVSAKERKMVEKELSSDRELSRRYAALKQSNWELNRQYPFEKLPVLYGFTTLEKSSAKAGTGFRKRLLWGILAAAAVLASAFFATLFFFNIKENPIEKIVKKTFSEKPVPNSPEEPPEEPDLIGKIVSENPVPDPNVPLEKTDITPLRRHFPIVSSGVSAVGIYNGEIPSRHEITPNDVHAHNNRGLSFYAEGEYDRALADYDRAIGLDPGYVHAYNNRGLLFYTQKDYDRALADFDKAIELNHRYVHAYNNRGLVFYAMKEDDRAIGDYTAAIELDPGYVYAYNNRGLALYFSDNYDSAIKDYTEAIGLDYAYAFAYNNRGNAYSANGDHDHAIKDYTEAIRIDPLYARSYYNLGNEYYGLKNYTRAIANYSEAIRLDPRDTYAYNNRGSVYYEMGNYDRAIADFDQALKIDPDYARARTNLTNAQREKERQGSKR